ncbi:MAG: alkaline phosphatase D family protein [Pseudomonadota bacterium]
MDRRTLLQLATALAGGTLLTPSGAWAGRGASDDPFTLGVASGAPSEDGFVLWTRIAPAALPAPTASATVRWELADDAGFQRIVARGEATAAPALGHSVHVELRGLAPDRWFFYRFMLGDAVSGTGRTRTTPAASVLAQRLRFAFASCQRWEHGYYAAWRHLAAQDPDLVVFLGDYIYEYAMPQNSKVALARNNPLRHAVTLADYRDRYALHKSDPDLQAAHRACPWIFTWDDHEVENDYAGLSGREPPAEFLQIRAAAYQAFYENMPLRSSALVHGLGGLGQTDAVRVAERYGYGRLARFHVLDTRQFRDLQACRDPAKGPGGTVKRTDCAALDDPARTLLGTAQEQWLDQGFAADGGHGSGGGDSGPRWSIVAQQTLFSPRHYGENGTGPVPTDSWDGYPAARQRLLDSLAAHKPRNAVFIGGDVHQNFVCNVHTDANRTDTPALATEFCGTSVTSFSGTTQARVDAWVSRNPQIVYANPEKRGYVLAELTPKGWTSTLQGVDDPLRADSAVSPLARFVVEDRQPVVQKA